MRVRLEVETIVLFFAVLVCGQVLAVGVQRQSSLSDEPVSVSVQSQGSSPSSLIHSCSRSTTAFRVRFQSIKTKMTTFTRALASLARVSVFATKMKNVSVNHIGDCANKADAGGFGGFHLNDSTCTLFNLEKQVCKCGRGEVHDTLLYLRNTDYMPLPQVYFGGGQTVYAQVAIPSTVFDQNDLFTGRMVMDRIGNIVTIEEQVNFLKSMKPGIIIGFINGESRLIEEVDLNTCALCDAPKTITVNYQYSLRGILDEVIRPKMFLLSECGNTINVDQSSKPGSVLNYIVMSHQGFGCQWYPKEDQDHECILTFSTTGVLRRQIIIKYGAFDGNRTTCEGDSIGISNGTSKEDSVPKFYDPCSIGSKTHEVSGAPHSFSLVFKRSATQYQPDGFNYGFRIQLFFYS